MRTLQACIRWRRLIQIGLFGLTLFALTGCDRAPLHLLFAGDDSESAHKNLKFAEAFRGACQSLANGSKFDDHYSGLLVTNGTPNAREAIKVQSSQDIHPICQRWLSKDASPGATDPCPAWKYLQQQVRRSKMVPLVLSVFENHDAKGEFCAETLRGLSSKIAERGGRLLIIGAENVANNPFSEFQWDLLHQEPHVKFCNGSGKTIAEATARCVEHHLTTLRQASKEVPS